MAEAGPPEAVQLPPGPAQSLRPPRCEDIQSSLLTEEGPHTGARRAQPKASTSVRIGEGSHSNMPAPVEPQMAAAAGATPGITHRQTTAWIPT